MQGNRRRSVLRRRKAGLTDYRRRLRLLRSEQPRAVVRISNTRTSCQLVTWAAGGDNVAVNVTGNDLVKKFDLGAGLWGDDVLSNLSQPNSDDIELQSLGEDLTIERLKKEMIQAAERLEFEKAAQLRDKIFQLENSKSN